MTQLLACRLEPCQVLAESRLLFVDPGQQDPVEILRIRTGTLKLIDQDLAGIEKFRDDTSASRKAIVVKRSELNALLRNDNPDEKKVAKSTGELYDIETELEAKAEEAGVRNRYLYEHGPNMMRGYGGGRGGHMMGW